MIQTEKQLQYAMQSNAEHENLEFKEARNTYSKEEVLKYCCALANERGGNLILGVTDKLPRKICGTKAFPQSESLKLHIFSILGLRVQINEIHTSEGKVLAFNIPSRPIGTPLKYQNIYWMRIGESCAAMTPDHMKKILSEGETDFSSQICEGAEIKDLDPNAISEFRKRWARKSGNSNINQMTNQGVLESSELMIDKKITYAALILLGSEKALTKYLAQAETVFEYRSTSAMISYQQRKEIRKGFFLWFDDIWNTINLRNEIQQFQDGFFRLDIPTFREVSVREAILNTVCHRDYTNNGSVFIKQYSNFLVMVSPGGFPSGITPETIVYKQHLRNRRIAEALARCGLVERSGQGVDLMIQQSIKDAKPLPNYKDSDAHEVRLTLKGQIQDVQFLKFLEKIGKETLQSFSVQDLLVLDAIHKENPLTEDTKETLNRLKELGVIEQPKRNKFILSRRFYEFIGKKGAYTLKKGLDKGSHKELLTTHIRGSNNEGGSPMRDLLQVIPHCSREEVKKFLRELRVEGKIHMTGTTSAARWFSGKG